MLAFLLLSECYSNGYVISAIDTKDTPKTQKTLHERRLRREFEETGESLRVALIRSYFVESALPGLPFHHPSYPVSHFQLLGPPVVVP